MEFEETGNPIEDEVRRLAKGIWERSIIVCAPQ